MTDLPELTPQFLAMNGRDKWETLVLHGLVGTNEPWIAELTKTLREEAAESERKNELLANQKQIAAPCSFCGEPATDKRSGESDIFEVCAACGDAWDANPTEIANRLAFYSKLLTKIIELEEKVARLSCQ